jgi:hypothetical protein
MPVEIKELHIQVALTSTESAAATATAAKSRAEDKECIIAECVEQVLQILRNRADR